MAEPKFIPLTQYIEYPQEQMKQRAAAFYADMHRRRSVRKFSDRAVPREIIENCLLAAATAPSGANTQPWHFSVVGDTTVKKQIRQQAEKIEHEFYTKRASRQWLDTLAPLGTGEQKPFLEIAPYLIIIFAKRYSQSSDGRKIKHYYVTESVGIATGILITAIHNAGLVSLPYTPAPMNFLNKILGRPENERLFLILVVGYPAEDAVVPELKRKSLEKITTFI